MKEYQAVKAGSIEKFNNEVNKLLLEGWELYGSVSCSTRSDGNLYCQALVREKESTESGIAIGS